MWSISAFECLASYFIAPALLQRSVLLPSPTATAASQYGGLIRGPIYPSHDGLSDTSLMLSFQSTTHDQSYWFKCLHRIRLIQPYPQLVGLQPPVCIESRSMHTFKASSTLRRQKKGKFVGLHARSYGRYIFQRTSTLRSQNSKGQPSDW